MGQIMSKIEIKPEEAWCKYLRVPSKKPGWLEDSNKISDELPLSKRELFCLILLSHVRSSEGRDWLIGYDENDPEPNDGYITDGNIKLNIESKIAAQFAKPDTVQEMINIYKVVEWKGQGYGYGRILTIYLNRESDDINAEISVLTEKIAEGDCPFDMVIDMGALTELPTEYTIHIHQHFPIFERNELESGFAAVILNRETGQANDIVHKIRF